MMKTPQSKSFTGISQELVESGCIRGWKFLHARKSLLANASLSIPFNPDSVGSSSSSAILKPVATWKFLAATEKLKNQASTASELFPTVVLADADYVFCGSAIYAGVPADPTILYPENRPIRIWDRKTNQLIQSIDAHLGAVNDLVLRTSILPPLQPSVLLILTCPFVAGVLDDDWLISASYDRTIKGFQRGGSGSDVLYEAGFTAYGHSRSVSAVKVVGKDDSGITIVRFRTSITAQKALPLIFFIQTNRFLALRITQFGCSRSSSNRSRRIEAWRPKR
jgi:WD40 repeat protein